MNDVETAKNLLADRVCENCTRNQDADSCSTWWGEAIGWQWGDKKGTCDKWSDHKNPLHVEGAWVC